MGGGNCFLSLRLIALLIRYPISEHLPLRHRIANSNVNHNSLRFIIILCLKRRYVYVNLLVSRKGKEKNIFMNCGHSFPQIPRLKSRNRYHEVMVNFWETKKKLNLPRSVVTFGANRFKPFLNSFPFFPLPLHYPWSAPLY